MASAVLTRDPVGAQPYASALTAVGLVTIAMPVTRTVPPADADALARAARNGSYDAVVVMSPRAAHELIRSIPEGRGATLGRIWAVGPATRRVLDDAGWAAHHPDEILNSVQLINHMVSEGVSGSRVLVPRAEDGRTEPLEILRGWGADVVEVVAYRTVAAAADDPDVAEGAAAIVGGTARLVGVFAPSQVDALAAIVKARGSALAGLDLAWCAIGETTARALRELGVRQVGVAAAPTPEGMAQAASSVYPPRA